MTNEITDSIYNSVHYLESLSIARTQIGDAASNVGIAMVALENTVGNETYSRFKSVHGEPKSILVKIKEDHEFCRDQFKVLLDI